MDHSTQKVIAMNNKLKHTVMTAIAVSPLVYLATIWQTVPARVPVHFDTHGPDKWDSRGALWMISGMLAGVSMLVYLLLHNMKRVDPKRMGAADSAVYGKMAGGIVVFIAALNFVALQMSARNAPLTDMVMLLLGLLFAFMGNLMHNIKPNYFAGIRLPWTLASDNNWRLTHRLAGKLWFGGGIVLAVLALALQPDVVAMLMPFLLGIMVAVPVVYSFFLYRQEKSTAS